MVAYTGLKVSLVRSVTMCWHNDSYKHPILHLITLNKSENRGYELIFQVWRRAKLIIEIQRTVYLKLLLILYPVPTQGW